MWEVKVWDCTTAESNLSAVFQEAINKQSELTVLGFSSTSSQQAGSTQFLYQVHGFSKNQEVRYTQQTKLAIELYKTFAVINCVDFTFKGGFPFRRIDKQEVLIYSHVL